MADPSRRFVVLEHRWLGVHWDFLVEDGDILRSWAVDAPIVPDLDLPARALPTHRRAYLDYEGPISGDRGEVRRWDQGVCEVLAWDDRSARIAVRGDQLVGLVVLRSLGPEGSAAWRFRLGKLS